jgi:hypothetical protein
MEPLRSTRVMILVGVFALLCATSWLVITIDQTQEEGELLHAGVKTVTRSSSNNNTPHKNISTTTAVAVSEPALDAKDSWREISNRLCPNMKPKSQLARTIFRLARQELIKGAAYSNTSISSNNASSDKLVASSFQHQLQECNGMQEDGLSLRFFSFAPEDAYSRASDGSNSKNHQEVLFTYFPMWKCANNQLRGFWEQMFGRPKQTWKQHQNTTREECIVMAVRDPISHFLSGYNEIESRISQFRNNVRMWPFSRLQAGSSDRFQQLITDLLDCPIERHYHSGWFGRPRTCIR